MLKLNTSFLIATCCFSTLASAQTTNIYTYDELGRVVTATDTTNGLRTFTYDAAGNRTALQVSLPSNRFPVAVNDSVSAKKFTNVYLNVLGNDSDPDGDALSIVSYGTCSVAVISTSGVGLNIVANYAPSSCSFTYTISDGKGGQSTATVFVSTTN